MPSSLDHPEIRIEMNIPVGPCVRITCRICGADLSRLFYPRIHVESCISFAEWLAEGGRRWKP